MKIHNWKVRSFGGYMTVEASVIVPISLILLAMIVYLAFFLYDKSYSVQACYLAALRGSQIKNATQEDVESYTQEIMMQLCENKWLAMQEETQSVKVTIYAVTVEQSGRIAFPFRNVEMQEDKMWQWESYAQAKRLNPASYIRRVQNTKKKMEQIE